MRGEEKDRRSLQIGCTNVIPTRILARVAVSFRLFRARIPCVFDHRSLFASLVDGSMDRHLRPDNIITYARIRDTIGGNTIRAMGLSGRRARLFGTELGFRSTLVPRRPVKPIAFIHAYVTSISITICKLI